MEFGKIDLHKHKTILVFTENTCILVILATFDSYKVLFLRSYREITK